MRKGLRGKKNVSKEEEEKKDYDPTQVPKELHAFNKPGAKDFNAPGTVREGEELGAIPKGVPIVSQPKKSPSPSDKEAAEAARGEGKGWKLSSLVPNLFSQHRGNESHSSSSSEDTLDRSRDSAPPTESFLQLQGEVEEDLDRQLLHDGGDVHMHTLPLLDDEIVQDLTAGAEALQIGEGEREDVNMTNVTADQWQKQLDDFNQLKGRMEALQAQVGKKPEGTDSKLDKFEGDSDSRPADMWLEKAESKRRQLDWTDVQFIEACVGAMTKDAESWIKEIRTDCEFNEDNTLTDAAEFRKQFLKRFNLKQSVAAKTRQFEALKQGPSETSSAFWTRVVNLCADDVKQYVRRHNMNPVAPTENAMQGNEDFRTRKSLYNFAKECSTLRVFCSGLRPHLAAAVDERVNEWMEEGGVKKVLEGTVDLEVSHKTRGIGAGSQAQVAAVAPTADGYGAAFGAYGGHGYGAAPAPLAAYDSSFRGRGGGGGRGRGGGLRGRGGGRGGGQNAPQTGELTKLRAIQSRTRKRYCGTCRQWAKHGSHECRHTSAQIAAMTPMDPEQQPQGDVVDKCFDGKDVMPPWPAETAGNA